MSDPDKCSEERSRLHGDAGPRQRFPVQPEKPGFFRSKKSSLAAVGLLLPPVLFAAPLPPGVLEQLDDVVGQRVEATAVLGTQNIASRSGLGWKLNGADGSIVKLPWKFELLDPQPVGDSLITWAPVVEGGAGYGQFQNYFDSNVLAGNESDYDTLALSLGSGPRFYLSDSGFSVLPAFDLLLAHTENHFFAHTLTGEAVAADGQYVNWRVWTVSFVPSFELRYQKTFDRWTPEISSDVAYFNTLPMSRSTQAVSFRSDSMVWANKFDLDYRTDWKVGNIPIHLGGDFSRTDLYGGLRQSLNTGHYYQTDARITFDVAGKFWKITTVGIGAGYFWSSAFDGYAIGLEGSLAF